ncbi:MAG: DEAD/DEAH box helicase family protein [Candidatus Eisenbacteria bacterium]|nr:DEAD/DEAH box helicase family protein [Candidatus Eisenbacteria bacterium]
MARMAGDGNGSAHLDFGEWLKENASKAAKDADEYQLHLAAHEWDLASALEINSGKDFESLEHLNVKPYDHQLENAIVFFRQLAPRGLIADDVGLGKTITAGLIATELLHRGHIESLLIVCPKGLAEQWKEELESKFRIQARAAFGTEFTDLKTYPYWITSYDTARSKMAKIRARGFDMLVLDEAHQLKNLYPSNPPQRAVKFRELMHNEGARFVIMLTATPIQNRLWDIYSQLDILKAPLPNPLGEPDRFRTRFIADPDARRLVKGREAEFRQRVADATVRTRRRDTKLLFPTREVKDHRLKPAPEEAAYIEKALAAIMKFPKLTQIAYARGLMSSPWAAAASFEKRAQDPTPPPVSRDVLMSLAREGRAIQKSAKVQAVVKLVEEASKAGNPRIIVFTMRLETLRHLATALSEAGFAEQIGVMQGGAAEANQRAIREFMADPVKRPILLASDVGAVGLNLQAGNIVINYDLPWNPMLIEQRIGRVQRLGQKAKNVIVYNLVLKNTIEEHVVLRLMEKLALFTQAIGEMEELLAGLGFDDEEDGSTKTFEAKLMELIRKSLEAKDTEADFAAMEQSRRDAEQRLQEVRERNESMLASLRPKDSQTRLEGLERSEPRLSLRDVVLGCLRRIHAAITVAEDGSISFRDRNNRTVEMRFERTGFGPAAQQSPEHRVVLPGTAAFEALTRDIREGALHHLCDTSGVVGDRAKEAVRSHLAQWGLQVGEIRETASTSCLASRVAVKASIEVKGDRHESVIEVDASPPEHGVVTMVGSEALGNGASAESFNRASPEVIQRLSREIARASSGANEALERDANFQKFRAFYGERLVSSARDLLETLEPKNSVAAGDELRHLEKLGRSDPAIKGALEVLRARFAPRVQATPVGVQGLVYSLSDVEVEAKHPDQRVVHPLKFRIVPISGVIVEGVKAPEELVDGEAVFACPSGHLAPASSFEVCHVDGCEVEICGECAPTLKGKHQLFVCPLCEKTTCHEHSRKCDGCRRSVCLEDAMEIAGGRFTCSECMAVLEDGSVALEEEIQASAISGRRARRADMVRSPISGRYVMADETAKCEESGRALPVDELALDGISGRTVGMDLLEPSAVSGKRGLRTKMVRSALSNKPMLPGEQSLCDESGRVFLPDELGYCEATGKRVDPALLEDDVVEGDRVLRRLLGRSSVSGRHTRPQNLIKSDRSDARGLVDEMRNCSECGSNVAVTETGVCSESGAEVCTEHLARCEASGALVLEKNLGTCEVTRKRVRNSLLRVCPETGMQALGSLFEKCEATGVEVLPEGLQVCAATGKRVRGSLLTACEATGKAALANALETCAVTGKRVLPAVLLTCPETNLKLLPNAAAKCEETGVLVHPSAVGTCASSGATVRQSLLARDDVAGGQVLARLLQTCSRTGTRTLAENLEVCSISGDRVLTSQLVACEKSGRRLLPELLKTCSVTQARVHPNLVIECPETGATVLREASETCEASGALVAPSALDTCSASGKRVRRSLLAQDEFTGKKVYAPLLERCQESGRMTLRDAMVTSAGSGKRVAESLATKCEATGRPALPAELEACARSGKHVLPEQLVACEASGSRVLQECLQACQLSGKRVLPEHLGECSVTKVRVLKSMLTTSDVSGRLAQAGLGRTCGATGRHVLMDEVFTSDISGKEFLLERLRPCITCGKKMDASEAHECGVCGQLHCEAAMKEGVCVVCTGLLRGSRGRKLTSAEVRALRQVVGWIGGGITESRPLARFVLARTGALAWKKRRSVLVLTPEGDLSAAQLLSQKDLT